MMVISQSMTTAGTYEPYLLMGADRFSRKLSIGNNWTYLRIGIRCCFDSDTGTDIPAAKLFIGVSAGTGSAWGDDPTTITHSVGVIYPGNPVLDFTRVVGTPTTIPSYQLGGSTNARWGFAVNGTASAATNAGNQATFTISNTGSVRSLLFVDLQKNSATSATKISSSTAAYRNSTTRPGVGDAAIDVSAYQFYSQIQNPTVIQISHSVVNSISPININTTEASGSLDSVTIAWDRNYPMLRIYDLAVHRFS